MSNSKNNISKQICQSPRYTDARGYVLVKIENHPKAIKNGYAYEHVIKAEIALGKSLPYNAVVHHHSSSELVICQDQAYHLFIHQRSRALKACGNVHWRKCGYCKKYDNVENLILTKNNSWRHASCHKDYMKKYHKRKRLP